MEDLCKQFSKISVLCGESNLKEINECFQLTKRLVSDRMKELSPYTNGVIMKITPHLERCNYRYIEYMKNNLFNGISLEYLDRMIVLYGNKMSSNVLQYSADKELELLFITYHIDNEVIKYIQELN